MIDGYCIEPKQEIFKIFNKDSIVQIKDISKLKFSDMPQSENVIANKYDTRKCWTFF